MKFCMVFVKFVIATAVLAIIICLLAMIGQAHADPPGGRAEVADGILIYYNGCRLALPNSAGRAAMAAIAYWHHDMNRKTLARIVNGEVFPGNYEAMRLIELCKGA